MTPAEIESAYLNRESPAAVIESARLASDPVKSLHAFRVREALRLWLLDGPGRECRIRFHSAPLGMTVWWVELFDARTCRASVGKHDLDDATAHALQIAED